MSVKVSVIVPVYNCKDYLPRCLDSLVNQTLKSLEIVCVNDGSTDESGEILKTYQENHPDRISVYTQENQGQGAARNFGVSVAKGSYIAFVDSDDYIELNAFEKLAKAMDKRRCDIVVAQYYKTDKEGKETIHCRLPLSVGTVYSGSDYLRECGSMFALWNKLYRKSFIEAFPFEKMWFEDVAWTGIVMSHNPIITYLDTPFYHYIRNADSTVSSVRNLKTIEDSLKATRLIFEGCAASSMDAVAYAMAKLLLFQSRKRPVYATAYYELMHEYRDVIKASPLFQEDTALQNQCRLYLEDDYRTIPVSYCYALFGNDAKEPDDAWRESVQTPYASFVCLNEQNCDISAAPEGIQKAYENGNYDLVGHYYKLCHLKENGGVAIDPCTVGLRTMVPLLGKSKAFFSFVTAEKLNSHLYGSVSGLAVLSDLIAKCGEQAADDPSASFETIMEHVLLTGQHISYDPVIETDFKRRFLECYDKSVRLYATSLFSYRLGIGPNYAYIEDPIDYDYFYSHSHEVIKAFIDYHTETEVRQALKPILLEMRQVKKQRNELLRKSDRLDSFNDLPLYRKILVILKYKNV